MNTRPGPDETTDSIDELVVEAMFPKIENYSIPIMSNVSKRHLIKKDVALEKRQHE